MENLKIRVNNEAEAEEVKNLAIKAGYTMDALFGKKWSSEFCYLLLCEDMSAGFGNEIMADGDKPLPIGELWAMTNPMREYLDANRNYEFVLSTEKDDGFIEIPEGAIQARFYPHDPDGLEFENAFCQWWHDENQDWFYYADYAVSAQHSRVVWQRDQDEPFLTPETTLNDQYAEIEQVRQVEIHGTVKAEPDFNFGAAQSKGGVDATLTERQTQYGCYEDVAHVTQQILSALRIGNYDKLPAPMKESLHMIASKMARIVNGDPEYLDNWYDIGGYAKLIEKLIKGE